MVRKNVGLNKTVSVSLTSKTSQRLQAELRDFLDDRGIEEVTRRKGVRYTMVEYDADDMIVSWKKLQYELEQDFPEFKTQYTEGVDEDMDDSFSSDYEHLEIYN